MIDISEILALWDAAKALETFDSQSYREWVEIDVQKSYRSGIDKLATTWLHNRFFVSFIICDNGNDDQLRASLASLPWDKNCVQLIAATSRDRSPAVALLLAELKVGPAGALVVAEPNMSLVEAEILALSKATGDFIAFLSPGDKLAAPALATAAALVEQEPSLNIVYSDEDWLDDQGQRCLPRFKTAWDPDAQLSRDLLGRFCLMRREMVVSLGGLRPDRAPAQHYDLHCRLSFVVAPSTIRHVPSVLYHRCQPSARERATNAKSRDLYAEAARSAAASLAKSLCGQDVAVTAAPLAPFVNRVHWPLPAALPLVSILIPTRDRADLLRNCVEGVLDRTNYPEIEVLILDNDSSEVATAQLFRELEADARVRIVPTPGPFNYSHINNVGAAKAAGEILLFMNNDIEVIGPDWLREMVSHVLRPDIGCVGAKLLYADGRLQHAGVVMKPGPLSMHVFRLVGEGDLGYDAQLAGARSYSAVTAACLAVRRAVFEEVGGFDEQNLKVAFNDVDLCLKIDEHGYRNVCVPFEPLFHLESASRFAVMTPEKIKQDQSEQSFVAARWSDRYSADPFAHPNVQLSWGERERLCSR